MQIFSAASLTPHKVKSHSLQRGMNQRPFSRLLSSAHEKEATIALKLDCERKKERKRRWGKYAKRAEWQSQLGAFDMSTLAAKRFKMDERKKVSSCVFSCEEQNRPSTQEWMRMLIADRSVTKNECLLLNAICSQGSFPFFFLTLFTRHFDTLRTLERFGQPENG